MKNNTMMIVIAVVLIALVGVGVVVMSQSNSNNSADTDAVSQDQMVPPTQDDDAMVENNEGSAMGEDTEVMEEDVKVFEVIGSNFKFDPAEMTVKKGDTVRIVFTSGSGMHDWVVDEYDVRTQVLQDGESETIEFVADQAGTFEYYCSVGQHREMGMVGTLTVEE